MADIILFLKKKVKGVVIASVVLWWKQQELQGNTYRLFGKLEQDKTVEAPAAADCHGLKACHKTDGTGRAVAGGAP